MWSSPCRSGKRGLRGDIPKHSFGVSCPLWNPHLPLQLPPRKPRSTWWGPPPAGTAGGLMAPTSRTLGKRGQVSPALGQQVPTPSPASWPAQGSSVEREQRKVGGGRLSVPTAANIPLRDTSHGPGHTHGRLGLGEPGAGPARFPGLMVLASDHLSHLRGLQGKGPTTPRAGSTQSARVLGPFQQPGEARPNAHAEPGHLSLGHPQPSAVAPPLRPWGGRGSRAPGGRHLRLAAARRLRAAVPCVPVPRPQAGIRGAFESWRTSHSLPQLLSQGLQPAGALSVCGQTAPSGCSPRAGS